MSIADAMHLLRTGPLGWPTCSTCRKPSRAIGHTSECCTADVIWADENHRREQRGYMVTNRTDTESESARLLTMRTIEEGS